LADSCWLGWHQSSIIVAHGCYRAKSLFANLLAWGGAAAAASVILAASTVTWALLVYNRVSAFLSNDALEEIKKSLEPNVADAMEKVIENRFELVRAQWTWPGMFLAISSTLLGISLSFYSNRQLDRKEFGEYLQANMLAAIVNFVILGMRLIALIEAAAERARLNAIIWSDSVQRHPSTYNTLKAWAMSSRPTTPPTEEEERCLLQLLAERESNVPPVYDLQLTNYLHRRGQRVEDLSPEERWHAIVDILMLLDVHTHWPYPDLPCQACRPEGPSRSDNSAAV
jgi:hypothetical protein